jgi:hypothetical protein
MEKTPLQETVSRDYAGMLKGTEERVSCCDQKSAPGMISGLAGYEPALHHGVASQSFGCDNRLASADIQPGQTLLDPGSGAGLDISQELIDEIARMVAGKVWSAKFTGRMAG